MSIAKTLIESTALGLNGKTSGGVATIASAVSKSPASTILAVMQSSYQFQRSNPTAASADVPSVFGQITLANNPTTDTNDPVTKLVMLSGDAAMMSYNPNQLVSSTQKANLFKYIYGVNKGLRTVWNYNTFVFANNAGGLLGDVGSGNMGNNYDATSNPTGATFPINLNVGYTEFVLDGDLVYFQLSNNSLFQVWINDIPVSVAPTTGTGYVAMTYNANLADTNAYRTATGGNGWLKIKFSTWAKRNIKISMISNTGAGPIYVRATNTITPRYPNRITWLNMGDSFCAGSTYSPTHVAVGPKLAELAGSQFDFVNDAQGGTGFNSGASPFPSRLQTSLAVLQAPSIITIIAGQNDTAAGITSTAPAFLASLRARWPNAAIHVSLNYCPASYATSAAKEAALIAACAGVTNCGYIPSFVSTAATPTFGQSWLVGTGKVGATTGDGTADTYVGNDGTHPTVVAARDVWAENFFRGIVNNYLAGITY